MAIDDEDLGAQLRALFADDRMSLPPRGDAAETVLRGARRRRRTRLGAITVGGAAAVVAIVLGGAAMAGVLRPHQQLTPAGPGGGIGPGVHVTTSPAPAKPTLAPSEGSDLPSYDRNNSGADAPPPTLGPDGYASLRLGMTEAQALATGMLIRSSRVADACVNYQLVGQSTPSVGSVTYNVMIAGGNGIELIAAPDGVPVSTPQGIGIGSTRAEVQKNYPDLASHGSGPLEEVATVIGNSKAWYDFTFDGSGKVTGLFLELKNQTCTG